MIFKKVFALLFAGQLVLGLMVTSSSVLGRDISKTEYMEYAFQFSECAGLYRAISEHVKVAEPNRPELFDGMTIFSQDSAKVAIMATYKAFGFDKTATLNNLKRIDNREENWRAILTKKGYEDRDFRIRVRACEDIAPIRADLLKEYDALLEECVASGECADEER